MRIVLLLSFAMLARSASSQTNEILSTPVEDKTTQSLTNANQAFAHEVEEIRKACIEDRRRVCGRIVKVLPEGLVIDSGYTNLMRELVPRSWLIPSTVQASRPANLIEEKQPEAMCVGLVFLTDIPKGQGAKPTVNDYVNVEAFPIGPHTYVSVGELKRTVRGFSFKLAKSVDWRLANDKKEETHGK